MGILTPIYSGKMQIKKKKKKKKRGVEKKNNAQI